jgi:nitroreductase
VPRSFASAAWKNQQMSKSQLSDDLAALIEHRRSIRSYVPEPIPRNEILRILSLAGRSPSAWNLQPWRFIAVTETATKLALQQVAYGQAQVAAAPVVLIVYSDMAEALQRLDEVLPTEASPGARDKIRTNIINHFDKLTSEQREAWGRSQAGIALGYLLLILESRGYGSSPMLGFDPAGVRQQFSLPDHVEIAALVAFGKPAEEGRLSIRHPIEPITRFF